MKFLQHLYNVAFKFKFYILFNKSLILLNSQLHESVLYHVRYKIWESAISQQKYNMLGYRWGRLV